MEKREIGRVARWERSWGWIRPAAGDQRQLFAHFTEIEDMEGFRKLEVGDDVSFARGVDSHGRSCAQQIRREEAA
jgi:cold shock CspA family protein